MDEGRQSQFNKRVPREAYVLGDETVFQDIKRNLEVLDFVKVLPARSFSSARPEVYFVIAHADFAEPTKLQEIARYFALHKDPNAYRILYVNSKVALKAEDLLFAQEIGAGFTVSGAERDADLRAYLKRISLQAEQFGSNTYFANEVTRLLKRADVSGLKQIDERLATLDKDAEEVLRLRAMIAQFVGKPKAYEAYLKRILAVNPQNLWAACELGKYFVKNRRAAEGIEVLEKMSQFHNMNGERLLNLGNAYLNVGDAEKAEDVLTLGSNLNGGEDQRFAEGIAKAKVLRNDTRGALAVLKDMNLSEPVVSFLNVRAIMAIRSGQYQEGLNLYNEAVERAPEDDLLRAKLHYNYGLGFVRANQPEKAVTHFEHSLKFGGSRFRRASRPLDITRKIVAANARKQSKSPSEAREVDAFEFEEFNSATKFSA